MEFKEILKYKPSFDLDNLHGGGAEAKSDWSGKTGKRKREDGDGAAPAEDEQEFVKPRLPTRPVGQEETLKFIEDDDAEGDEFDAATLRKLCLQLEKHISKNQELRIKFSDNPSKFLESETDLHGTLQELHVLATAPSLYGVMIKTGAVKSVLSLLGHENLDIAIATIELLQELTDTEALEDEDDNANAMINCLFDNHLLGLLVQCLGRMKEPDDSNGVHQTLGILENILELDPKSADRMVKDSEVLSWLLIRLKGRKFDRNKLYASEILSILIQDSDANRKKLGELDGINRLLGACAQYKRKDPADVNEMEMMENIFNSLCSAMILPDNAKNFIAAEGTELMLLLLREKKLSQYGAIKVLNHAMSKNISPEVYSLFVDRLGLKSLFPVFMKTPGGKHRKVATQGDYEEHVCSIMASLFKFLEDGTNLHRLLRKFIENDYAKVERLVELHISYFAKAQSANNDIAREKAAVKARGEEIDEFTENEYFLKRLDAGLATLQSIDYIIGMVCRQCGTKARDRFRQLFKMKGTAMTTVEEILEELERDADEEAATPGAISKAIYTSLLIAL